MLQKRGFLLLVAFVFSGLAAPTLDAIDSIKLKQFSVQQPSISVTLTGITSGQTAGLDIFVKAYSNNANVAEDPVVVYQSPETSASLQLQVKPGSYGMATITVYVYTYTPQQGQEYTSRKFTVEVTPSQQSCQTSPWSEWSACSRSCGQGVQKRTRTVIQPAQFGGAACGELSQERICSSTQCPPPTIDPIPVQRVLAGSGEQIVELTGITGGGGLEVTDIIALSDNAQLVPHPIVVVDSPDGRKATLKYVVQGSASGSVTIDVTAINSAGQNVKMQFAIIVEPQTKDCVLQWGAWGECSQACGTGIRTRSMYIVNQASPGGSPCPTQMPTQTTPCVTGVECATDCQVGWSSWSACSTSCGAGQRYREQVILAPAQNNGRSCPVLQPREYQDCNFGPCPTDCELEWGEWSVCSATCGPGTQTRSQQIKFSPSNGGKVCPQTLGQEQKPCQLVACARDCQLSAWSEWSPCDRSCGGGQQKRNRTVVQSAVGAGKKCDPFVEDARECNTGPCSEYASCKGICGGMAASQCGCDSSCVNFNDCCEDYTFFCLPHLPHSGMHLGGSSSTLTTTTTTTTAGGLLQGPSLVGNSVTTLPGFLGYDAAGLPIFLNNDGISSYTSNGLTYITINGVITVVQNGVVTSQYPATDNKPALATCKDRCGNGHDGKYASCNCDATCGLHGDCCSDFALECPTISATAPVYSCVGRCGWHTRRADNPGKSINGCQCDLNCVTYDDCCFDFKDACDAIINPNYVPPDPVNLGPSCVGRCGYSGPVTSKPPATVYQPAPQVVQSTVTSIPYSSTAQSVAQQTGVPLYSPVAPLPVAQQKNPISQAEFEQLKAQSLASQQILTPSAGASSFAALGVPVQQAVGSVGGLTAAGVVKPLNAFGTTASLAFPSAPAQPAYSAYSLFSGASSPVSSSSFGYSPFSNYVGFGSGLSTLPTSPYREMPFFPTDQTSSTGGKTIPFGITASEAGYGSKKIENDDSLRRQASSSSSSQTIFTTSATTGVSETVEAPPLLQAAVPQMMASQAYVPPAVPQVMASQTGVPQVMASQVPVSQTFSLSSTGQMVGGNVQDSLSQPTSMMAQSHTSGPYVPSYPIPATSGFLALPNSIPKVASPEVDYQTQAAMNTMEAISGNVATNVHANSVCYCDNSCISHGDCCHDYAQVCQVAPNVVEAVSGTSCKSRCGVGTAATADVPSCYCDAQCHRNNDCCSDKVQFCGVGGVNRR
mmetsp:Transcript_16815/g.32801  ORF Transcript_16815/g.32801 Transcript_16815/m.32801 type:complete len:1225 (-) Transcript_16815:186-3860(-)